MILSGRLLSIAIVTIMALTVVSGAGVLKAEAETTPISNPSSQQIASALDCTSLGPTWWYTPDHCKVWINTDLPLSWVALDKTTNDQSQLVTSVQGPGTLTFRWCAEITSQTNSIFRLVFDGKEAATCRQPVTAGAPTFATATVEIPAGKHTLYWTLTGGGFYGYNEAYLRDVHFTPAPMPNAPTQTSVLADLTALRSAVNGMSSPASHPGTTVALRSIVDHATLQVKSSKYDAAANTLRHAFIPRADGCALRGRPDAGDLVRTCLAQDPLYDQASAIVQDLTMLAG